MKVSEVFKEVAKVLPMTERRCSPYICDNIRTITNNNNHPAQRIINKRLGGKFSVYEWLIDEGHIQRPQFISSHGFDDETYAKIQQYRKAWCLELAREFEAKGE